VVIVTTSDAGHKLHRTRLGREDRDDAPLDCAPHACHRRLHRCYPGPFDPGRSWLLDDGVWLQAWARLPQRLILRGRAQCGRHLSPSPAPDALRACLPCTSPGRPPRSCAEGSGSNRLSDTPTTPSQGRRPGAEHGKTVQFHGCRPRARVPVGLTAADPGSAALALYLEVMSE
jgi:hypothetical protein